MSALRWLLLLLSAWTCWQRSPAHAECHKPRGPPQRPRTARGIPAQRRKKAEGQARQGSQ